MIIFPAIDLYRVAVAWWRATRKNDGIPDDPAGTARVQRLRRMRSRVTSKGQSGSRNADRAANARADCLSRPEEAYAARR